MHAALRLLPAVALAGCGTPAGAPSPVTERSDIDLGAGASTPEPATLHLHVIDGSGAPVSARVGLFRDGRSLLTAPRTGDAAAQPVEGALGWRTRRQAFVVGPGEEYAYVAAESTFRIEPGPIELVVAHGMEHRPAVRHVTATAGTTSEVEIALQRWSSLGDHGFTCADLHVHLARFSPDRDGALLALLDAEDLHAAALSDWAGRGDGRLDPGWGGWAWPAELLDDELRGDALVVTSQAWGLPDRACRMHFFGHRTPVTGRSGASRASMTERVLAEGGIAAGALGQIPVDGALLGDVAATEVLALGQWKGLDLWYDLLSSGARITAIAGTDAQSSGVPETIIDYHSPPGANRVCVAAGGPLTARSLRDGIAAGRTFVTNGPTLFVRAGGVEPGGELRLAQRGTVNVEVALAAALPPGGRLLLIRNGQTVAERAVAEGEREVAADFEVAIDESAWLAVRFDGAERLPGGDVPMAHTSPVYVTVSGAPAFVAESAGRVAAAIPSDDAIADSGGTGAERRSALDWARRARAVLERRRRTAEGRR